MGHVSASHPYARNFVWSSTRGRWSLERVGTVRHFSVSYDVGDDDPARSGFMYLYDWTIIKPKMVEALGLIASDVTTRRALVTYWGSDQGARPHPTCYFAFHVLCRPPVMHLVVYVRSGDVTEWSEDAQFYTRVARWCMARLAGSGISLEEARISVLTGSDHEHM